MINEQELNYELFHKDRNSVDVEYYRAITAETASSPKIKEKLLASMAESGFEESDVSYKQFLRDYEFGKYTFVKDWIRFYAEQGLRLKREDLFRYIMGGK